MAYGGQKGACVVTAEAPCPLLWLEDLVNNPALLAPPPVVLPRLAWEERVTLLAAPEKSGKSTLVGQGVAALVTGQFFLEAVPPTGTVLWLALDEPVGDLVRRLHNYGAHGGVAICEQRPAPTELAAMIRNTQAKLLVVDTLSEFANGLVADGNAATQWVPLLRELRAILKGTGSACILLHHSTKASERGGRPRYRDSSQIGAGVDVIIEMAPSASDTSVRKCLVRGRVKCEPFTLRYIAPHYNLEASGELSMDARILLALKARPGLSKRQLRDAVPGKVATVTAEIERMVRQGLLADLGDGRRSEFYVKSGVNHPGTARKPLLEPLVDDLVTPIEPTGNRPGTTPGTGGGSHPLKGVGGNHLEAGEFERDDAFGRGAA